MITDTWTGCYPSNWKGKIVPEAMAHPAKYSSKLIRRIYEHMLGEGWIARGDKVVDPFGGVALGAFDAMRLGLNWYGCELEPRFVALGNQNIDEWNKLFSSFTVTGSARLLQGDSRKLTEVLGLEYGAMVSSPPYADSINSGTAAIDWEKAGRPDRLTTSAVSIQGANGREEKYGSTSGQLGAMKAENFQAAISSPPFKTETEGAGLNKNKPASFRGVLRDGSLSTGESDANLANMPANQFQAAISSPPFLQSEGGTPEPKPGGTIDARLYARHAAGNKSADGYGTSDGQLSSMKDGSFDAAISSPPYNPPMSQDHNGLKGGTRGTTPSEPGAFVKYGNTPGQLEGLSMDGFDAAISSPPFEKTVLHDGGPALQQGGELHSDYGQSVGQLANDSGNDFWLAARAIVEQVYLALTPGGHAVWVVKDYVKNKQIVPFSDQWRQLCEAVGFVTLHEHRAMLVHYKGAQHGFDGSLTEYKTESKSFFRRLAEKKGSPRIDWETVYCMVKE